MRASGATLVEIARVAGISHPAVMYHLRRGGISDAFTAEALPAPSGGPEPSPVPDAARIAELEARLRVAELERDLAGTALRHGVRPEAGPDFVRRGVAVFGNGSEPPFSRRDPARPMPLDEWAGEVVFREAPHLFCPSTGGGASGTGAVEVPRASRVAALDPFEFGMNLEAIARTGDVE